LEEPRALFGSQNSISTVQKDYLWNGNQFVVGFSSDLATPAGTQGLVYNALQVEK